MRALGLDIGTTTLSCSLWEDGREADCATLAHGADMEPDCPGAHIQDPDKLVRMALDMAGRFGHVDAVGLTGQMHGIVYVDLSGRAVSPLYTWQDTRSRDVACELKAKGLNAAAGYGLVTHAYLSRRGQAPKDARIMTIMDLVGLRLCGNVVMHASNAASLGGFDAQNGEFDTHALHLLHADRDMLPPVTDTAQVMGVTHEGVKVVTAIGDNQASYLGAAGGDGVLVTLGTGGQVSAAIAEYRECPPCEVRPLDGGRYLAVGSILCGGRAYAIWERFLRMCAGLAGNEPESLYDAMNRMALEDGTDDPLFLPLFCGSREDPTARGEIRGLTEENLTPAALTRSLLGGLCEEVYGYYEPLGLGRPHRVYASGNAIRKNAALQRMLEVRFGAPVVLSPAREEAAFGAARLAADALSKGERV